MGRESEDLSLILNNSSKPPLNYSRCSSEISYALTHCTDVHSLDSHPWQVDMIHEHSVYRTLIWFSVLLAMECTVFV